MKLTTIQPIALEIWRDIKPFCEKGKCKIAGSIRRQSKECKDIELVISPKNRSARTKIGSYFLLNGAGIIKGKFTGRYVKMRFRGVVIDLFIPQSGDYFRQFAIRTGSADYSKKIAYAWKKKGYVGTAQGLQPIREGGDMPPKWTSERHFFEWLGMEYISPSDRN